MNKFLSFGLPVPAAPLAAAVLALCLAILGCDNGTTEPELVALTGTPTISGTAKVGQTLTAAITGLNGTGTPTYQWKVGESMPVLTRIPISRLPVTWARLSP